MMLVRFGSLCLFILSLFSASLFAETGVLESLGQTGFLPAESTHANWVFSGVVANENGDSYAYFFQMQRQENTFHVISALFDAQTKALVLLDEGDAVLNDAQSYNWHVGHSFLRFNAINDSWIFGVKTQEKTGYNFKVDMLNQPDHNPIKQGLRTGVEFIASQTGQLNGHIQFGPPQADQFVTAKNAWFRQVWLTNPQEKMHPLTSVLCRFNDGSGFYSMNMMASDAMRGAVAGWYDAMGTSLAMSQFTNVKQDTDGLWHIRIASPALHLVLSDSLKQDAVVAGFVTEKDKQGFCMLNHDAVG